MNYKRKAIKGTFGLALELSLTSLSFMVIAMFSAAICELHGFSQAQFSFFFSLYSAGSMLGNFFLGKLIAKLGIKKMAILGALAPVFGFTFLAFNGNIILNYCIAPIFGMLTQFVGFVTSGVYVNGWFNRGKGKMMSVASTTISAFAIVMSPLAATVLTALGAKTACLVIGVAFSGLSLLTSLFLVSDLPQKYGASQVDVGKESPLPDDAPKQTAKPTYQPSMSVGAMLTMPVVLICLSIPAITSICVSIFSTYQVYIFQDFGFEYVTASLFVSIAAISSAVLAVVFGILCDKIGTKNCFAAFITIAAVTHIVSVFLGGTAGAIILAGFYGVNCFINMFAGLVIPPLFGNKNSPTLMGYVGTLQGLMGVFAAPIGIALYTANNNSYSLMIIILGIVYAVSLLATLYVMSNKTKNHIIEKDKAYLATQKAPD